MIRFFKKYGRFAKCAIEMKLAYRIGFLFRWLENMAGILVSIFLWRVLFQQQSVIQGYDWNQMILYALIAAMLNATLSYSTELKLAREVLDGSIASDLTKPVDIQNMCFFQTLGSSVVEGGLAFILISALAFLLADVEMYLEPVRLLLFVISVLLAFLLKFCLAYIGGITCFFTSNGYGVVYLRQVITDIFSGALLPLSLFPGWFQKLSGVLPFQASVYFPTQIFLGRVNGGEIAGSLFIQASWVAVLWIGGRMFFQVAVKKVTIQGG